ncbi:MAG: MBL fold metallo-hydrolase [Desulfovibrionaceae bacterium]|nr:MBL fold metallo-hydrolase [Desulfovibrionaceae bacterium]
MPVATFPIGPLGTNSYVLSKDKLALVIDVGGAPSDIITYLSSEHMQLAAICITHLHFDHIYGVAELALKTSAPVYVPDGDSVIAKTEASRGGIWGLPRVEEFSSEKLPIGDTTLAGMACTILETPGHTPGSVSFYFPESNLVFTGDALFYHSVGRTDFPLGDSDTLLTSIRTKLFTLPDSTRVYPGHGPETSIREEKQNNPFCGEFAV